MIAPRAKGSEYMEWAKTRSQARYNLASSGVAELPMSELPIRLEDLELTGPSFYGYPPLQERLAQKAGVGPECVVAATGASMANHLALAAFLEPGDHTLIEEPAYGPLVDAASYLGAEVGRFPRRAEDAFALDPEQVERALRPHTRLVVLSNLHNPSSALVSEEAMLRLGALAGGVGARVLVDEVYLDALFERPPRSAFALDPERFVVTSSLTKAYGLGGLRCGWIVTDASSARRLWRLNDLFGVVPAHLAERLSMVALDHLGRVATRAKALLDGNRATLQRFLDGRTDLDVPRLRAGMTAFPRLRGGRVDALCALLREKYDTTVVPGRFFGLSDHFRISYGCLAETLAGGLQGLGAALDEIGEKLG
jgi:aspartate/methionine/tyrosine aminotransferase